jgi:hypothetical protein
VSAKSAAIFAACSAALIVAVGTVETGGCGRFPSKARAETAITTLTTQPIVATQKRFTVVLSFIWMLNSLAALFTGHEPGRHKAAVEFVETDGFLVESHFGAVVVQRRDDLHNSARGQQRRADTSGTTDTLHVFDADSLS